MLAGYGLVLVMGTGNYLGTRFALSGLLVAAACLMVVCPMSGLSRANHLATERRSIRRPRFC